MKLLLLTRYGRLGSASRVRFYQYLPYLQTYGIEVTVCPLLADEYVQKLYANRPQSPTFLLKAYVRRVQVLLQSGHFDLIWLEKESLPWLPAWIENSLIRTPIIADYDDAVFHCYDQHANPLVRRFLGRKIDAVMRRAALVVAGNDYLAARARQAGAKRIEILPSVVDADRYQPRWGGLRSCIPTPSTPPEENFTIGWIGAPVTAPYLQLIQPALAEVCANGGASLIQVGGGNVSLAGVPLENRPWTEATEVAEIQRFDVGIMPLPDEPFERGKCGYKLIQYMACGLPVVATPIGANQKIVEHGVNGFYGTTTEEWITALTTLRDNPELRAKMGAAGRKKVETEYSLQVAAPKLLALFQKSNEVT